MQENIIGSTCVTNTSRSPILLLTYHWRQIYSTPPPLLHAHAPGDWLKWQVNNQNRFYKLSSLISWWVHIKIGFSWSTHNFTCEPPALNVPSPLPAVLEGDENPDIYKALPGPTGGHYQEHKPCYICLPVIPRPMMVIQMTGVPSWNWRVKLVRIWNEPRHEKTCLRGFRQSEFQISLLHYILPYNTFLKLKNKGTDQAVIPIPQKQVFSRGGPNITRLIICTFALFLW